MDEMVEISADVANSRYLQSDHIPVDYRCRVIPSRNSPAFRVTPKARCSAKGVGQERKDSHGTGQAAPQAQAGSSTAPCATQEARLTAVLARPAAPPVHQLTLPSPAILLKAKARTTINRVMATYLSNLEEVADQHDESMGRLIDALPAAERAKVHLADHFGETRFEAIRKHVLKAGNDSLRELEDQIDVILAMSHGQTVSHP